MRVAFWSMTFVMWGVIGLVGLEQQQAFVDEGIEQPALDHGGLGSRLEVILRNYRHYTKLPDLFGGVEGMHDRKLVVDMK